MEGEFKKEDKGNRDMLPDEAGIVERAKTDDLAFEILYDFYFPKIYGYIFKRVGSFDIAEDLVSTTFLKVFTGLGKYKDKGYPFGAWVYRIATNNLIDYYRKSDRYQKVDIEELYNLKDDGSQNPKEAFQLFQEKELVRKALNDLPKRHQEVLHLKFFAEKETKEMAEILKTSENNVRVLTHRALKLFGQIYKKYDKQ